MNIRKMFLGFLASVLLIIVGFTMFGWGNPLSSSNTEDLNSTTKVLKKQFNGGAITDIKFSPVEEMTVNNKVINVQTVTFNVVTDSTKINHFVILKVKKCFMKYEVDEIFKVVK